MDLFQFGGVDALNRSTALSLVTLLLRLTTLLGIWRMDQVARYWQARMRQRKRSGLIWEIGLFAAAILAQFLPMLVLNLILRIE